MFHRRFSVVVNHQLQIAEHFLVIGRAEIVEAGRVVALKHAIDGCLSVDGADLSASFSILMRHVSLSS